MLHWLALYLVVVWLVTGLALLIAAVALTSRAAKQVPQRQARQLWWWWNG